MRYLICIAYTVITSFTGFAQVSFKTIVPEDPIILGDVFPVQYVLENELSDDNFTPPPFKNFKLVSGPSIYRGNNGYPLKNTVYTLAALRPGKFTIEGAGIHYNGTFFKSNNAVVEVITKAEAFQRGILKGEPPSNSDLYLKPGEDPNKKISSNLFVKLITDKQSCYVGEPVTATFKLYSRLQSTSDIVKNPGFYGFTVYDVLGIKDNKTEKETVSGKQYDVHIIRKVQLYPLKAGVLTIDEMEIENTVVFTDSPALRKMEQRIMEGVIAGKGNKGKTPGTREYTSNIHTAPVTIHVKELPAAHKPAGYNGATGSFTIKAQLSKTELSVNEEAELIVTIAGKGNFTQLTAPSVRWPKGIEGFEPTVIDSLDKAYSPLKGSRTFLYPFVVSKAGRYSLPELLFSFFNPDTNSYKQVKAKAISLAVKESSNRIKNKTSGVERKSLNTYLLFFISSGMLLIAFLFFFLWRKHRNKNAKAEQSAAGNDIIQQYRVEEILQPAFATISSGDAAFYSSLRQCIWNYLSDRFGVSAVSDQSRLTAVLALHADEPTKNEILQILSETDTRTYGGISASAGKEQLFQRSLDVLKRLDAYRKK